MADTPLPQLSRASFLVVQTWLHRRGAAIKVALAYPVLEDQKADFAELLRQKGYVHFILNCQISAFIGAYPAAEKLSIDPSLAHLIRECQVPQSVLCILSSVSDSPWANEEKARPSYASQVPLSITQQWWRPFHEAARTRALFPPTPSMESPNTEDHIQRLWHAHESLREHLSFADGEINHKSNMIHAAVAVQVAKREALKQRLELYQVTLNMLKERCANLQKRAEESEALAAHQREELGDLRCQITELQSLGTVAPIADISYPGNAGLHRDHQSISDLFHH
ncbi:hypothetical protein HYDPIDRAFT_28037 [Hydnomerulius pinastri MD-312]|uniref:Uncharacterized protein n=1 Tax=Hydnomerulius pinastri MD-312 TaxID=994086 RepID=A0A0C9WG05_9AGAM|nr:hypothetical protein HYDPIDRAFT_28037 [Hydnomerulius pinastri MD-312]